MSGADDRFVIRARKASDAEGLAQLVNLPGYRYGTMRLPFHSVDEVADWIQKTPSSNLELVAAIEGQIIAQAGLRRLSGRQHHSAYLGMGVHDGWVRRGVGTALMVALLDAADNWLGIRRIQLTVYVDNAPAMHLYRRFGFVVEGTHQAYALRDGRYVDAYAMARISDTP
jgi:putative acetyltransferase